MVTLALERSVIFHISADLLVFSHSSLENWHRMVQKKNQNIRQAAVQWMEKACLWEGSEENGQTSLSWEEVHDNAIQLFGKKDKKQETSNKAKTPTILVQWSDKKRTKPHHLPAKWTGQALLQTWQPPMATPHHPRQADRGQQACRGSQAPVRSIALTLPQTLSPAAQCQSSHNHRKLPGGRQYAGHGWCSRYQHRPPGAFLLWPGDHVEQIGAVHCGALAPCFSSSRRAVLLQPVKVVM